MKVWDVLTKVGSGVVKQVFPAAGAVIDVVNEFLDDGDQLPDDATGEQLREKIDKLPPSQKAEVLNKELDVQIEEIRSWTDIQQFLNQADASGASTRPKIALIMAWIVAFAIVAIALPFGWAVLENHNEAVKEIKDAWPFITALLGIPSMVLRSYFGLRTKEKKARYNLAQGEPADQGIAGFLGRTIGRLTN